jgi:hypothetical protein
MARRQCAYCGTYVSETEKTCPNCREALLERIELHRPPQGGAEIRRGLIYMLLAIAVFYLAGPRSPVPIPIHIPPMVTTYLLPVLFLLGLGFTIHGAMRKIGIL